MGTVDEVQAAIKRLDEEAMRIKRERDILRTTVETIEGLLEQMREAMRRGDGQG